MSAPVTAPQYGSNYRPPAALAGPLVVSDDGIIARHVARTNRNLQWTNALILLAVIGVALLNTKYLCHLATGARHVDQSTLFRIKSAAGLWDDYVRVDGASAVETGMEEVMRRKENGRVVSEESTARYYFLTTDTQAMLVKAPIGANMATLTGVVVDIPDFERQQILPQMYAHEPGLKDHLLPIMLDAGDYNRPGLIGLAIGIPLIALAIWNLKRVARRKREPMLNPVMRALERYGSPGAIAAQIDSDIRANVAAPRLDKPLATPSWLLHPSKFGLHVLAVNDIIWAYKHVTRHYTNFIPTGKTYRLMIAERQGKLLSLASNDRDSSELLGYLSSVAPWGFFGYHADIANAWRSNSNEMVRAVDARRQQFLAAGAGAEGD